MTVDIQLRIGGKVDVMGNRTVRLKPRLQKEMGGPVKRPDPKSEILQHAVRRPAGHVECVRKPQVGRIPAVPVRHIGNRPVIVGPDRRQIQPRRHAVVQISVRVRPFRMVRVRQLSPARIRIVDVAVVHRVAETGLQVINQPFMNRPGGRIPFAQILLQRTHHTASRIADRVAVRPQVSDRAIAENAIFIQAEHGIGIVGADRFSAGQHLGGIHRNPVGEGHNSGIERRAQPLTLHQIGRVNRRVPVGLGQ